MSASISITSDPDPELDRVVGDGLSAFNDAVAGYADRLPLRVVVRERADGRVVGGVIGRTSLGLLFIDLVYLPEHLRGAGVGSRMIAATEDEARRRGCRAGVLYTISFQAPAFYERLGWRRIAEIPCDPPGTSRVFLTKEFV